MSGQNMCSKIRDVIRQSGRALSMSEIVVNFPPDQRDHASFRVCTMARNGILRREGEGRLSYQYGIGRELKKVYDAAERPQPAPKPEKPKREPKPRVRNPKPIVKKPVQPKRRPLVVESLPVTPAPPAVVRQTVEEFLAAGGTIEVLPSSATSRPLLRIGFDDDEGD